MKKLRFERDAREALLAGCEIMYKAVGSTFSPKGRLVSIQRSWGYPKTLADGVEVAREVSDKDLFVRMGIDVIREAAENQVKNVGDGTTLVTILTYELVKAGMTLVNRGVNPMVLRRQLIEALPQAIAELKKISKPVKTNKDLESVAYISSGSHEIAKIVTEAISKVGSDGQITVDESSTGETYMDYTSGMTLDKGYITPYFVTNPEHMEAFIDRPVVAVIGKKITMTKEIMPLLEVMSNVSKSILIIGDVGGEALRAVVTNKMKGIVNALVVAPPGYGKRRDGFLEDISVLTNARVFSDELALTPQQFAQEFDQRWLGQAKSVLSNRDTTVILPLTSEDATNKDEKTAIGRMVDQVKLRIRTLRGNIEAEESIFEKEILQERLAKLTTGVAVIRVGDKNEIAMREKLERVKDAIGAARAVSVDGIVPGGSVTLLKMSRSIEDVNDGTHLLIQVMGKPLSKLLYNAGVADNEAASIIKQIEAGNGDIGYEVNSGKIVDLVAEGIIDPAMVLRVALENSVTVAGSILCTDTLIVEEEDKRNEQL